MTTTAPEPFPHVRLKVPTVLGPAYVHGYLMWLPLTTKISVAFVYQPAGQLPVPVFPGIIWPEDRPQPEALLSHYVSGFTMPDYPSNVGGNDLYAVQTHARLYLGYLVKEHTLRVITRSIEKAGTLNPDPLTHPPIRYRARRTAHA